MPRESANRRAALREMLVPGAGIIVPGVNSALAARVVADEGFDIAYVTGAGLANTVLGLPDIGLVTLTELTDFVAAVHDVYPGYLIVDADTGFGNAINVTRTVRLLERAGADAIQIEDQLFPKRCGHFEGKEVVPVDEMVGKVKAAADARRDPDLLIVARTDSIATHGFEAALDRAAAYREAGADVSFVEAPQSREQIEQIPKRLPWPQLINIVIGGKTPEFSNAELKKMGYAIVLYANVALQSALLGMQQAIRHLRKNGTIGEDGSKLLVTFAERQRIVGKDTFDALERKYSAAAGATTAPKARTAR